MSIVNLNAGWNAGARSIRWADGDCEATVEPNAASTDVIVGLSRAVDVTLPTEQTHSFRFAHTPVASLAYVYERGEQVASLGAFVDGDLFKIRRNGSVVTYYKNGTLVHTSGLVGSGRVFVAAALWQGGDTV